MSYAIGIDLGGTQIKYGLVDDRGGIVVSSMCATGSQRDGQPSRVMENLGTAVAEMLDVARARGCAVEGIGVGAPGIIDGDLVIGCEGNLPEMEGVALGPAIAGKFGLRVVVNNDANCMGLAEAKWGTAQAVGDVVFLTIGTGVGGALILDGRLYGGYRNRGTELGHIHVASGERPCTCGARGCLEAQASVTALVEDYKEISREDILINGKEIVGRYLAGEPAAVRAMQLHFDYLASGVASLINVFAPQKLIIGGGISESGDFYIAEVRERALKLAMKETSEYTVIEAARLGNNAGFLGAAALLF
ncbi:MAG TPA: ROK family protein [Puia sp.]|nr:ROK family protein [Puia sp.]